VERADGGSIEAEQAAALEHAIDNGLREILVAQDAPPGLQRP